ncbi:MAG: hypothetical protein LBB75_06195 [Oscillospiraceae bacterium]|jgi:ComF family protein|nr:hypothetical protein [Oscillospiraceae bacterium]
MMKSQSPERLWLWFFPRRCVWCAGACAPDETLCADCAGQAATLEPGLLPDAGIPLVSVFTYHSQARNILLNFKFHGAKGMAHSIGYAMADAFTASHWADRPGWLFCAAPMTPAGVKRRGYNQSELLARAAARWLGMEYAPGVLAKTRETPAQHGLPKEERLSNVSGAFAAARPDLIAGRGVALCDDICTTGATLREAARVLQAAGANEIVCLTYLRTDLEEEEHAAQTL